MALLYKYISETKQLFWTWVLGVGILGASVLTPISMYYIRKSDAQDKQINRLQQKTDDFKQQIDELKQRSEHYINEDKNKGKLIDSLGRKFNELEKKVYNNNKQLVEETIKKSPVHDLNNEQINKIMKGIEDCLKIAGSFQGNYYVKPAKITRINELKPYVSFFSYDLKDPKTKDKIQQCKNDVFASIYADWGHGEGHVMVDFRLEKSGDELYARIMGYSTIITDKDNINKLIKL